MAEYNYGIGGSSDLPYEGMAGIPFNKTLIAIKLTDEPVDKPEIIEDLKNIEEVFAHFKPSVNVEFNDENASPVLQIFQFHSMDDFGINGLTAQSELLKELTFKKEIFEKIARQAKTNRSLTYAFTDKDARKALLNCLLALRKELE